MQKDDLIKHGVIILFASGLSFVFGYFFHSFMARSLGPEDYGIIDALLSLLLIILIPLSTIQAVVARFSSVYMGSHRPECIYLLMKEGFKKLLGLGILMFILISILSPFISDFLRIPSRIPVIFLGMAVLLAILLPVSRGILLGMQNFNQFGLNISLEKIILFISGVGLIGFGVNGAMFSLVLSLFIVLLMSFIPLRNLKYEKSGKPLKRANLIRYSIPVFISLSVIAIMSNIDMIIVKHYFDPIQAGGYATINIMGKTLFLLSFNIANVIYPKASELYIKKIDSVFLLRRGLFYMGIISLLTIIVYALFPHQIMNLIFGTQYLEYISLLVPYTIFMAIMAFAVIIVHYHLSTMNFTCIKPLIFSVILELIFLEIFHESLIEVVEVNLFCSSILLILLFKNQGETPD
jgi:O-antigen/teichoic acid export membrane protein